MRIYYKLLGGHYHCRVFFNGLSGNLVVGEREWDEFRSCFGTKAIFLPEASDHPIQFPSFASELIARLEILAVIADRYDSNDLDDEARKYWGSPPDYNDRVNETPPDQIELYAGRGGSRLLTLKHCLDARKSLEHIGARRKR